MFAEKAHGVLLVGEGAKTHPQQVHVIRHQDIGRADEALTGGGVQEQFAEMEMEQVVQPAGGASFQSESPVDHGKAAINFRRQPGKMVHRGLRG